METKKCKHCQSDIPKKAKVCPNCKKKQGGKLKFFLIAFLVIGIIGSAASNGEDSNESTSVKTNESNTQEVTVQETINDAEEEVIEYISCNVDDMMDLLSSNALKAEKEYADKYLEVTGRLGVIDSDGKYISLYPLNNEWAIQGIQCYIKNDEQLNKVLELEKDETVTIKVKCTDVGEVLGYLGDIIEFVN